MADLEAAGIKVIQIDEPALREGLPLHAAQRKDYLAWAVAAFKLASSGVRDETQIHTHMCYAEFNDIIDVDRRFRRRRDLDRGLPLADGTSRCLRRILSTPTRSGRGFSTSTRPVSRKRREMVGLLNAALKVVPVDRLWVNPDCGLKTRRWEEVRPALANMVAAAREVRGRVGGVGGAGDVGERWRASQ